MKLRRGDLLQLARLAEGRLALPGLTRASAQPRPLPGGSGNDFLDFAPYGPGDDLRAVDWRASGRRGTALVRRHLREVSGRWVVAVDCSASMMFGDRWACATDLAAGFSTVLIHQGHRVGVLVFDARVRRALPARAGLPHLDQITSALAGPPPSRSRGRASVREALGHLSGPSGLILISDLLWGEGLEPDLTAASAAVQRGHVVCLASASDAELPAGSEVLVDAETGRIGVSPRDTASSEAAARRELGVLRDRAARVCRARGLHYSEARVADGWRAALIGHLRGLAGEGTRR